MEPFLFLWVGFLLFVNPKTTAQTVLVTATMFLTALYLFFGEGWFS